MKHAGAAALAALAPLLKRLRGLDGLSERKVGTFYLRSSAFLHFHEDPEGLFADVKLDGTEFTRLPVDTLAQQDALVELVTKALVLATKWRGRKASRL